jgi:transcriptional regulator with XRE-family HTH domain
VINVRNYELVKAIGNKIRETRLSKNLSQEDVSYSSDLPLSQIGRIERGENNPTISSLYAIAQALDVELKSLVDVTFIAKKKK